MSFLNVGMVMLISDVVSSSATPIRDNSSSFPRTPTASPISPSFRRRLEFSPDTEESSKRRKFSLSRSQGTPEVTDVASSILPSPSIPQANEEDFCIRRRARNTPWVPSQRLGELVPKLHMDASNQKYLMWQSRRYDLTPISTDNIERQHQVWLGKTAESPVEVVMKTYNHITQSTKRQSIMKGDRIGYAIWQDFLKDYPCPGIRFPQIHSLQEEGVLVMEYIKVDQPAFWKEWENKSTLDGLSSDALAILTIARDVIALMWQHKIDLGDFRAENTIWKEGKLYPIDWQYIPESEKGDLVRNLKSYFKDWAKGNQAVFEFLSELVPDLLKASTISCG